MLDVSAVIPCHNGERYLAESLTSIRGQSRPVQEIVVVDDGSTDGSAALAESFGARVVRQPQRGEGAARNTGVRAARGDAIAWLDADDRWREHHLAVLVQLLERTPGAAAAFGAVQRFGTDESLITGYVPEGGPHSVLPEAFYDWLHPTIGSVVRKAALESVGGFDEHERSAVDFDLWLRLAHHHRFAATREVTSEWRMHGSQQSATPQLQIAATYRFRRRFLDRLTGEDETALRAALELRMADAWLRDVRRALEARDRLLLRSLQDSVPLVPALPLSARIACRTAALMPLSVPRCALLVKREVSSRVGRDLVRRSGW